MPEPSSQPVDNLPESGPLTEHDCPRCGSQVSARFYGPCDACRRDLRATITAAATDVAVPDYEPKMNVTPNAVATKE